MDVISVVESDPEKLAGLVGEKLNEGWTFMGLAGDTTARYVVLLSRQRTSSAPATVSRGPSAYMLFANEHRQAVTDANPGAGAAKVSQLLGKMWSDLPDAEKTKYSTKAQTAGSRGRRTRRRI